MGYLDEKARAVRDRRAAEAPVGAAVEALRREALARDDAPSLAAALRAGDRLALIAEFKRRSPSAGPLASGDDAAKAARLYERAGAAGVSVLTDANDFGGSLADLAAATAAVSLPVLRKDFIIDEAALYEARAASAAAALLIIRILAAGELESLLAAAAAVGLECLVEVHGEEELEAALAAGATLVGINNRDLQTLSTDLRVTERLAPLVPGAVTLVSESGIETRDDVKRVRDAGVHATLVGASLLRLPARARARKVAELSGVRR